MNYFEFYNPVKILSGENSLENIPYELNIRGGNRPFLMAAPSAQRSGLVDLLLEKMRGYGIEPGAFYDQVPSDPSIQIVELAARTAVQGGCDSILAIGGGSVMDAAKGVKVLLSHNVPELHPFMGCETIPPGQPIPTIMVPTTAGTGSECTRVAVLSEESPRGRIKHEFVSSQLLPDVAVLDPRSTLTLPPRVQAATGMDTLVHCVEAYTGLGHNPISDGMALSALELVGRSLFNAVSDPSNSRYRMDMLNASLMAGMAFSNSLVGLCHAIAHACGAVAQIPHGEAVAILLPAVMRYNLDATTRGEKVAERYGRLLLALSGPEVYAGTNPLLRGSKAIQAVEDLNRLLHSKCGLPLTLSQAGMTREQLAAIASGACNDGALLYNPAPAGEEEILQLLDSVF